MRLRSCTATLTVTAATATALFAAPVAARAVTPAPIVVYLSTTADVPMTVFTAPADGSTAGTPLFPAPADRRIVSAAVSPDGSRVAYSQSVDANDVVPARYDIWVRQTDGGGTPLLLTDATDSTVDTDPAWSADGTRIAFARRAGNTTTIWTVPADGGAAATAVPASTGLSHPSFSPSGRQLVANDFDGLSVLTIATGARAYLPGGGYGSEPVWSPDGASIAFVRPLPTTTPAGIGIASVPAGGGAPATLRVTSGRVTRTPAFSRDGSRLFWAEYVSATGLADLRMWSADADGSNAAQFGDHRSLDVNAGGGEPPAADTTAPAAPVVAAAGTVGDTWAAISWTADSDATEFVVVRTAHDAPAPASPADGTVVYDGYARNAKVSGLTTGTVYDLHVFALDAWGNASPAAPAHPVRPTPAPVMEAIGLHLGPDPALRPRWTGALAPYRVEVATGNGASFGALPETTKTSTYFYPKLGRQYLLRVRGTDGLGNSTLFSPVVDANVPLDDRYFGLQYSRGWESGYSNSRYANTLRWNLTRGASVNYVDNTSGFVVIGDRCRACGQVRVYIDGIYSTTVDTYAPTSQYRQVLYRRDGNGVVRSRRITLVVVGTPQRERFAFDGLALIR